MFTEESWQAYVDLARSRPQEFSQDPALEIVLDRDVVADFSRRSGRDIGIVYASRFNILVVDLVRGPDGRLFCYERVLPASIGKPVVAVPIDGDRVVLLRQFRHATRSLQYAFPRGFGENGLSPIENAEKELREELSASVGACRHVGDVVADSGLSGAEAAVVLCEVGNCRISPGYEGIEGAVSLTARELAAWIAGGRITDGFTLSAWALLEARRATDGERCEAPRWISPEGE